MSTSKFAVQNSLSNIKYKVPQKAFEEFFNLCRKRNVLILV